MIGRTSPKPPPRRTYGLDRMRNLSLFTGSGIGDLAAASAGIVTVAQCENDPACLYALRKLWPDVPKFEDVRDVSASVLRDLLPIDIISGGFPCQDISAGGCGAGIEGSRSGLWREMFRVIRQVRPTWLLIENVPPLRVRGADRVLAPLARIGYSCWPLVVGSWAVGAPHKRDRVWIVAHAEDSERRGKRKETQDEGRRPVSQAGGQSTSNVVANRPREFGQQRPLGDGTRVCRAAVSDLPARRFPAPPGRPQHDWEAPRLVEFGLGSAAHGLAERVLVRLGRGDARISCEKIARRTNKTLLRMIGNAWQYEIPLLIYQWIAQHEHPNAR